MMKTKTKFITCPNCGANIKYGINDKYAICEYCNSKVEVGNDNPKAEVVYVDGRVEQKQWIATIFVTPLALMFGTFIECPIIWQIFLILGAIIFIPPIARKIYRDGKLVRDVAICLMLSGFLIGAITSYEIPKRLQGKFVSDTTSMTVEIKGNTIIIEDEDVSIKENFQCEKKTYGDEDEWDYYTIKIEGYDYVFRLIEDKKRNQYTFYQVGEWYSEGENFFYNENNKDEYILNDQLMVVE